MLTAEKEAGNTSDTGEVDDISSQLKGKARLA